MCRLCNSHGKYRCICSYSIGLVATSTTSVGPGLWLCSQSSSSRLLAWCTGSGMVGMVWATRDRGPQSTEVRDQDVHMDPCRPSNPQHPWPHGTKEALVP